MTRSILLLISFAWLGISPAWSQNIAATIDMVRVPGGCFSMGSQGYERHEQPVHKVCLDSFEIGKYEVTQEQWRSVMGNKPSRFECGDNCPVERITWNQAQAFIQQLNAQGKAVFRLPTEAEWEYACRSGGKDEIWSGTNSDKNLADFAWFDKEAVGNKTHPVGTKNANGLGIHDMSGNVWEWVQDKFVSPYPITTEKNPHVETGGEEKRVIRGGSWDGKTNYVRCGIRNRYEADHVDATGRIGFRVVREITQK